MNTDLLREYIAFAECLNFTVAAKNLHISQPTLSRHLAELEKDLEAELVIRGQVPGLTYAGETLLAEASRLLNCENNLRAAVLKASERQSARLRIEYYPYMRSVMANANTALNRMQINHPEVHFDVDFVQPRKQHGIPESIESGYFDLAVLARTTIGPANIEEEPGICCFPMPSLRSRICFFMAADNPLAANESISVSQLDGVEVLFPVNLEFQNFREDMRSIFAAHGASPVEIPCRVNDMTEFAYSHMGRRVHVLTEDDLTVDSSPYLTNPSGKVVRCAEDIGSTPYFLFKADDSNPAVEYFLDALETVLQEF